MRFEDLERQAESGGPLQRIDARIKILATLGFVIAVVATPIGFWRPMVVMGLVLAFVVGLSGISPRDLFERWLGFVVLVGFLAVMVAQSHPARPARHNQAKPTG